MMFNCFHVESLLYYSRLRIVSSIFNSPEAIDYIKSFMYNPKHRCPVTKSSVVKSFRYDDDFRRSTTDAVVNKVSKIVEELSLPEELISYLKSSVHPMALSLEDFLDISLPSFVLFSNSDVKIRFNWTDKGILDETKTSEFIIQHNFSYQRLCLELASIFCIDYLVKFEVPDTYLLYTEVIQYMNHGNPPNNHCKVDFQEVDGCQMCSYPYYRLGCELCWKAHFAYEYRFTNSILDIWSELPIEKRASEDALSEKISSLSPQEFHDLVFENPFPSVIKYFVRKINSKIHCMLPQLLDLVIKESLGKDRKSNSSSIILYLATHLSSVEALKIFKENAYDVLDTLLHWPCLHHFQPVANELYSSLSCDEYLDLIVASIDLIEDCNEYKQVLFQFWDQSPDIFKDYVREKLFQYDSLCLCKYTDVLEKILNGVSADKKLQMICSKDGVKMCYNLIDNKVALKTLVINFISDHIALNKLIECYKLFEKESLRGFVEIITPWFEFQAK